VVVVAVVGKAVVVVAVDYYIHLVYQLHQELPIQLL
jgi:hypothetical protein